MNTTIEYTPISQLPGTNTILSDALFIVSQTKNLGSTLESLNINFGNIAECLKPLLSANGSSNFSFIPTLSAKYFVKNSYATNELSVPYGYHVTGIILTAGKITLILSALNQSLAEYVKTADIAGKYITFNQDETINSEKTFIKNIILSSNTTNNSSVISLNGEYLEIGKDNNNAVKISQDGNVIIPHSQPLSEKSEKIATTRFVKDNDNNIENILNQKINLLSATIFSYIQDKMFPVGSIYISINENPENKLGFGQWELISKGRCLWGSSNTTEADRTIEAGLPNIEGEGGIGWISKFGKDGKGQVSGPFAFIDSTGYGVNDSSTANNDYRINFNASRCSNIYGKSNTVQPSAYVVNIWKRIS